MNSTLIVGPVVMFDMLYGVESGTSGHLDLAIHSLSLINKVM